MAEQPDLTGQEGATFYCLFAGFIDQSAVQRFHNLLSIASHQDASLHLLFQCAGGNVADGISLYNLIRKAPTNLTIYNVGCVCSIGVIVFLGAKHRKANPRATFMIHRTYINQLGTSERLTAAANQISIDDQNIESILKEHTKIPADKWEMHKYTDVWFSANDAVNYGIADSLDDFAPPLGTKLINVWPPQN